MSKIIKQVLTMRVQPLTSTVVICHAFVVVGQRLNMSTLSGLDADESIHHVFQSLTPFISFLWFSRMIPICGSLRKQITNCLTDHSR